MRARDLAQPYVSISKDADVLEAVRPGGRPVMPAADPDCTAMEIAELMARARSPLVAVVERGARTDPARLLGVITAAHLLRQLLEA
jgi:CBS domain-containing protein